MGIWQNVRLEYIIWGQHKVSSSECARQRCYACCLSFSSLDFLLLLLSPRECAATFWKVLVTSRRTTSLITTDTLTHQQNARICAARTLSAISSPISAPSVTSLSSVATLNTALAV